jgi:hypothetical protein
MAICAKKPRKNLNPASIDLRALLIPKTVFFELVL